jgi:hypothetical protein
MYDIQKKFLPGISLITHSEPILESTQNKFNLPGLDVLSDEYF